MRNEVVIKAPEDLFEVLEETRTRGALTMAQMSARAGLAHGTYWAYVQKPTRDVGLTNALRYAAAIGMEVVLRRKA